MPPDRPVVQPATFRPGTLIRYRGREFFLRERPEQIQGVTGRDDGSLTVTFTNGRVRRLESHDARRAGAYA